MDDKLSTCKQCSLVIAPGLNSIGCEGFCTDVYHASCVKMSYEELIKYSRSHNMWWMCNSCSDKKVQQRSNRSASMKEAEPTTSAPKVDVITRIDGEIEALKQQVIAIHQSLAISTATSSRIVDSPAVDRSAASSSSSSSLKTLPNIQQGTKGTSSPSSIVEQQSTNDRFWLFLTRIKNYVTEREVLKLVCEALSTDDVIVKRLVPAWKDSCSMPFVSFKVGINVRLKRTALLPSSWPRGLHFREFHNNYWEPL